MTAIYHLNSLKRSGDVSRLVADNKLIIEKLNWRAKSIDEICKSGWSF